jgi:hypothetical protein
VRIPEHHQLSELRWISSRYADGRQPRQLGLVVVRGPTLVLITPTDGYEGEYPPGHVALPTIADVVFTWLSAEIENPFAQEE